MTGPDIEAVDEVKALILNSGICQCMEELQEEDTVKEQYRCNPTEQERTGQKPSNVYTLFSGLEDLGFNDFFRMISFQKVMVKSRQVLRILRLVRQDTHR